MILLESSGVPGSNFQLFEFSPQIMVSIEQKVVNTISFFNDSLLVCLIQISQFLLPCLETLTRLHVLYIDLCRLMHKIVIFYPSGDCF